MDRWPQGHWRGFAPVLILLALLALELVLIAWSPTAAAVMAVMFFLGLAALLWFMWQRSDDRRGFLRWIVTLVVVGVALGVGEALMRVSFDLGILYYAVVLGAVFVWRRRR